MEIKIGSHLLRQFSYSKFIVIYLVTSEFKFKKKSNWQIWRSPYSCVEEKYHYRSLEVMYVKRNRNGGLCGLAREVKQHEGSCVYWRRYPKASAALSGLAPWWGADIFMCHARWVGAHILHSWCFSICCPPRDCWACARAHRDSAEKLQANRSRHRREGNINGSYVGIGFIWLKIRFHGEIFLWFSSVPLPYV
jgi:hypothetical protein